jgi:hypothetical protein
MQFSTQVSKGAKSKKGLYTFHKLQIRNSQKNKKDWAHKSQIRKVSRLLKVYKSNKLFKFSICGTY